MGLLSSRDPIVLELNPVTLQNLFPQIFVLTLFARADPGGRAV
jgi:hypothetical protein